MQGSVINFSLLKKAAYVMAVERLWHFKYHLFMKQLVRFGPSGMSEGYKNTRKGDSLDYPAWLRDRDLTAYEYSFGRGVRMAEARADALGKAAEENGVVLSLHAPYYINFASKDKERRESSIEYLRKTAVLAKLMHEDRIVFHPGSCGKINYDDALQETREGILQAIERLDTEGIMPKYLCPETMGKSTQIGDLIQTIEFCTLDERLLPCIDFGHVYARSLGDFGSIEDYANVFDRLEEVLGYSRAVNLHVHFSRIEFTKAGEKKHWNYEDVQYGPDFDPLANELAKRQYQAVVICESRGNMAEDAMIFQKLYREAIYE